jgi:hypothetical protein
MALKFGFACRLFRNTGSWGAPTWAHITLARDAKLVMEDAEFDASSRGSGGFEQFEPTTRRWSIETSILYDPADTQYTALRDAYLARTALDLAALDGASSGANSQGMRASFKIFQFSRNEALRDGLTLDLVFKPCFEQTNLPTWVTFA